MFRYACFLAVFFACTAAPCFAVDRSYSGEVTVYGQAHKIQGDTSKLTYDDEAFTVTGVDADGTVTAEIATEGSKNREDVLILKDTDTVGMFRSSTNQMVQQFQLQNAKEVKCGPEHNAVFILRRLIVPAVVSVGNCMTLQSSTDSETN